MPIDFTRTRYTGPADLLGYLLYQSASLWRCQMNARLSAIGLTYIQFVFLIGLAWLTRNGEGITQKDLGRYCKASRALTSQVIRLLERNGLIIQAVMQQRTHLADDRATADAATPSACRH
jgi:DNA-binding MarR family transcriptional regulator